MTDNEKLSEIWEFLKRKLSKVDEAIEYEHTDEDYNWGRREAFKEVLNFMDDLMDRWG